MIDSLTHTLALYRRLLSVQVRSQMQYRVSFVLELVATIVNMSLIFLSVALVLQRFGGLGGWSVGEVAFLWGMVEMAFGTMDLLFGGFDPATFGRKVRLGTFDQILLRPVSIITQVLGSEFLLRRLGRIAQGMVIFGVALALIDMEWTVGKVLYWPLVIGGLIAYFGALFIIGSTFTFWTVESIEAFNILTYGGTELMAYPMHIYASWLRRTFTYAVPAIFLNYYPALYFLDKPDPFGLPGFARFLSPLIGAAFFSAALAFWQFGIKHYQSTGN